MCSGCGSSTSAVLMNSSVLRLRTRCIVSVRSSPRGSEIRQATKMSAGGSGILKRRQFTLDEKINIIKNVEGGQKIRDAADEYQRVSIAYIPERQ